MKANKRVRDLARRSPIRLIATCRDGLRRGTTTFPYGKLGDWEDNVRQQRRLHHINICWRSVSK